MKTCRTSCACRGAPPACVAVLVVLAGTSLAGAVPPRLPADPAGGERLRRLGGEGFRLRETDHFSIAYNTDYEAVRPLIGRLEGTFDAAWRFCDANDLVRSDLSARLRVLLFDKYGQYARYSAGVGVDVASMAGFYQPRTNIAVFCNMLNSPMFANLDGAIKQAEEEQRGFDDSSGRGRRNSVQQRGLSRRLSGLRAKRDALVKQYNRFVIQHEATHQLLYNLGVHVRGSKNPAWLVEGLACQFEVPQTDPGGALNRVNQFRLADMRDALGIAPGVKRISQDVRRAALSTGRLIPVAALIGRDDLFEQDGEQTGFRYAQAWSLVFYLFQRHRPAMIDYLHKLARRRPGTRVERAEELAAFESVFGTLDDRFERDWLAAVARLRYDPSKAGR